jgi:putative NIF3 family GTP cyclohydrolase 1 type 2
MVTANNIYNYFGGDFSNIRENWDNNGVLIGDPNREIRHIAIAMDVTDKIIDRIKKFGDDTLLITHHPLIFNPIKKIEKNSLVYKLIENDITYLALHTQLDYSCYTQQYLHSKTFAGLSFGNNEGYAIGTIYSTTYSFGEIIEFYKNFTGRQNSFLLYGSLKYSKKNKNIGFIQGSANSFMNQILNFKLDDNSKLDLLITGELTYHNILELNKKGIAVLLLGHDVSELFLLDVLKDQIIREFKVSAIIIEDIMEFMLE